jgi:hypothetical protein
MRLAPQQTPEHAPRHAPWAGHDRGSGGIGPWMIGRQADFNSIDR